MSPGAGVGNDFSARYEARLQFAGGSTRFDVVADDGVRVLVDGIALIDSWVATPVRSISRSIVLSPGPHDVVVEYFDDADWAVLRVAVRPEPPTGSPSFAVPALGTIDTWARFGDGSGSSRLNHGRLSLTHAAIAPDGTMYVAETLTSRISKIATNGSLSVVAGNGFPGSSGDNGPASSAMLSFPSGLAYSPLDNSLYVADTGNHRIRRIDLATGIITAHAGTGTAGDSGDNGPALSARFNAPAELAVDSSGNVVVIDTGNGRVRRIATDGTVTTVAGGGSTAGRSGLASTQWQLRTPTELTVDPFDGTIYVTEEGEHRVTAFMPDGHGYILIGGGSLDDQGVFGESAELERPSGLVVMTNGDLLISDKATHIVMRWSRATGQLWRVAGCKGDSGSDGDGGQAIDSHLTAPEDLQIHGSYLYVIEPLAVRIRRIAL